MADAVVTYDEVAYPTNPNPSSHPDRLAVVARLMGLEAAGVEGCSYLELGCGDGMNLIPMAEALPNARFVGVDISASAVARGQQAIAEIGLTNVTVTQGDILKLPGGLGSFDYVVAHGVYSWVPPNVRDALLKACAAHLAPHGVAYVSYNAMPGGHIRNMVREMMLFHVRELTDPAERIAEAKAFLGFILRSGETPYPDAYRALMLEQAQRVARRSDADLFHDDLAVINDSIHVGQFAGHASQHGLQFLGEADFFEMSPGLFGDEAAAALGDMGERNIVFKEQYLDFLKCRQFRKTLLCRREVQLNRAFNANRLTPLWVSSDATPEGEPGEDGAQTFQSPQKGALTTANPLARAALAVLAAAYPAALRFSALAQEATAASGEAMTPFKANASLAEILHAAYGAGAIELHTTPRHVVAAPGAFPFASACARWQASRGDVVTNLRHEVVEVTSANGKALLQLCDGTRDREALVAALAAASQAGDPVEVRAGLAASMDANLEALGRIGLLVR